MRPQPARHKYVQTKTTGSAAQRQYLDSFGRTVGTRARGFDGNFVYTAQFHNAKGQVTDTWAPFLVGDDIQQTHFEYDPLGRILRTDYPDGSHKTHSYSGLNTSVAYLFIIVVFTKLFIVGFAKK